MAQRDLLRTPEGAWYRDYAEYKDPDTGSFREICYQSPRIKYAKFLESNSPRTTYEYQTIVHGDTGEPGEVKNQYPWSTMHRYTDRNEALEARPPPVDFKPAQHPYSDRGYGSNSPVRDLYQDTKLRYEHQHREEDAGPRDAKPYNSPRREASPRRDGYGQEWAPASPRRQAGYEPSFHDRDPSPRRVYPWERDAGGQASPRYEVNYQYRSVSPGRRSGYPYCDPRGSQTERAKPVTHNMDSGALLFIRYPWVSGQNHHRIAQISLRAQTSDLRGSFLGISRKVYDYGYPPGPEDGLVVFQFPSLKNAEIFFYGDRRIRQPDFPAPQGHAEIFGITFHCDPALLKQYDTFLLNEVTFKDGMTPENLQKYETNYKAPLIKLLAEPSFQAYPFAAFCLSRDERVSLRRHFFAPNSIISLHLFRSPENLHALSHDQRYHELRHFHNTMATERCSVFTVEREPCP